MKKIKLKISNPSTNVLYKKILLRKFFYMVFVDGSGHKLSAYIATVFGGITKDDVTDDGVYSSVQQGEMPCALCFEFIKDDNSGIEKIELTDLTESFWEQDACFGKVWGNCKKYIDQTEVAELLVTQYPRLYDGKSSPMVDVSRGIYHIKQGQDPSHTCIVDQGTFTNLSNSKTHMYSLSYQESNKKIDGLEVMNWVKAEIDLGSNVLTTPVQFTVELDKGKIYTPDFTWYFAPPAGYVVGKESYVNFGDKAAEKNAIQPVSDETTVVFKEWARQPVAIEERKKSRIVLTNSMVSNMKNLSEDGTISVTLFLENPQGPSNRQFFVGLLVAFLLSFCADKTRLNDFYACLKRICTCPIGECSCASLCNLISVLMPVLILATFLSMVMNPKRSFPPRHTKIQYILSIFRIIGITVTCLLIIYIFAMWMIFSNFMGSIISCFDNKLIIIIGYGLALVSDLAYLIYCLGCLKRKIYNYL